LEATREIYWNVGHGVVPIMYVLAVLAVAFLAWGFYRRIRVYRRGRPVDRLANLGGRVSRLLVNSLGQVKVMKVRLPGITHASFFWGFLVLFIGTLLVMVQADLMDPFFDTIFLKGDFYRGFSLVLDIAGLVAIIALVGLLVRRFVVRPDGLDTTKDDYIMHGFLLTILITGFVIEGARMAVTELDAAPELARYSPVGLVFAHALYGLGKSSLQSLHKVLWWVHLVLAVGFIASIPLTKFRHMFTTSANYLFSDLGEKGVMSTMDLEDEEAEQFGAAELEHLTWKDVFDGDACTVCKRCQDRCPAYRTEKPLSPMRVVLQLEEAAFRGSEATLIEDVGSDVLWSCTTCRACEEICPAEIEHLDKILEMRRNLVLMEGEFPGEEVTMAVNNVEVNGNPFGLAFATRGDWAEETDMVLMSEDSEVDVLYFPGCYASFDSRNQAVARSFARICSAAGLKVGILGGEEKCCGEPLRKLGNEYLYQAVAAENIEKFQKYGVTKIVTTCPHCFNTLGRDYRDLGLEVEVEHYTLFLDRLLRDGSLELEAQPFDFTYHDSCYIGRYRDIMDAPRQVLQATGGRITEMDASRYESFCCGGGGGLVLAEEKTGRRINVERVGMAQETGASTLVSNCPFCLTMFDDGVKMAETDLQARDLAEIVEERLKT